MTMAMANGPAISDGSFSAPGKNTFEGLGGVR